MGPRLFSRGMEKTTSAGLQQSQCFNGAAAVQPRNGLPPPESSAAAASFNGAAAVQPRNGAAPTVPRSWPVSFNGAAAVQPRNVRDARPTWRPRVGFNGAAAVQPRNGAVGLVGASQIGRASMGPRLFSRGMQFAVAV